MISAAATVLLCVFVFTADASSFLSRAQNSEIQDVTPELEASILKEIDDVLGDSAHGGVSKDRLTHIEDMFRPTVKSMPKNENGKLGHVAVRYSLHSYFVQRHAWFVRGLANMGTEQSGSSPTGILQDKVEEFVQQSFETRLGTDGMDLHEIAVLAATYENLVRREMVQRLDSTFRIMRMDGVQEMNVTLVDKVLDVYMMGYIMNLNYTAVSPSQLNTVITSVNRVYPTWSETQTFLRDVRAKSSLHRSYFSRTDVESILEEVGDQYGRWQNRECQDLKSQLLSLEDRSVGTNGSGRVRLSDFYGSALRDGNWQFSESKQYLVQLGALDAHDTVTPRIVIPNYINSPSNCIASSKFYSVCCINECESLMDHIEHHFAAPVATPQEIIQFAAGLPSATVPADRTLHPMLVARLEEIARYHGGHVPLHGRLFAQWMHHAYPRECPYPHISGTTRPQTQQDYQASASKVSMATKDEMQQIVDSASKQPVYDQNGSDECTSWSEHEELYVSADSKNSSRPRSEASGLWQSTRSLVYVVMLATAAVSLVRRSMVAGQSAKEAVLFCGNGVSKDLFV